MGIGGGSKFTLEKTWRSTGVGTETFNASGTTTIPYGKQSIYVTARGGSSTANYNPPTPGNAAYNPVSPGSAYYNPYYPSEAYYNPYYPGEAYYNPSTPGTAVYNPYTPGNVGGYNPPVPKYRYDQYETLYLVAVGGGPWSPGYYTTYFASESFFGPFAYHCPSPASYYASYNTTHPYYGRPAVVYAYRTYSIDCTYLGDEPGSINYVDYPGGYNPPSGGNLAGYNAPSGGNFAGYYAASGGNFAGYYAASGGNLAGYNAPSGGNLAGYNAPSGGNVAGYNTGTPSTALGVTAPGGTSGNPGSVVGPLLVSDYSYPSGSYPVTVAPGGVVTIVKN